MSTEKPDDLLEEDNSYQTLKSADSPKSHKWALLVIIVLAVLVIAALLAVVLVLLLKSSDDEKNDSSSDEVLSQWATYDSSARQTIIDFVTDVTNPNSPNYVPPEDRIVVSDVDGTLFCETAPTYFPAMLFLYRVRNDTSFTPTQAMIDAAEEIEESLETGISPEGSLDRALIQEGLAVENMSLPEYDAYVKKFAQTPTHGFENLNYADAFFKPMIELVDYLVAHDFVIYAVSGSDREQVRAIIDKKINIRIRNVIGTDYGLKIKDVSTDSDKYVYTSSDSLVRGGDMVFYNNQASKVLAINKEIKQQPIMALGNSEGDISMHTYVTTGNKYRTLALLVLPDDDEREFANPEATEVLRKKCDEMGWLAVSMKKDFKTIYGEQVKKMKTTVLHHGNAFDL